ncbi:MAG TPA: response regulator transcription factor [Bryobacteraceae bacterium]|nr:response regulator transcription factor [Bryobacteraceae bacterium]
MRILVVEDDPDGGRVLCKGLREQAFAVDLAADGGAALHKAYVNPYDLIILDVMLPGKDGLEVCRELRVRGSDIPILMLTARDRVPDRIDGLNAGADDYLIKPFDLGELLARVHALLRRRPRLNGPVLQIADLSIDTHQRKVIRAEEPIALTAKEYALLEYLAWREGAVVGRAEISEHVWDETYDPTSNLIEVYVQRLRRKVDAGHAVRLIHTRRGEGYQLSAGEPDAD